MPPAEARRLALVFGVVYCAQGLWRLPNQPITFALKEQFRYSAMQVATLFFLTTVAWLLKPAYGFRFYCNGDAVGRPSSVSFAIKQKTGVLGRKDM